MRMVLLTFFVCAACVETDGDGDGFLASDCAPSDAAVHPGAPDDDCDGVDDDCDGSADEESRDARLWYPDEDRDGWGVPDVPVAACLVPEGYSTHHSDCDDADASTHPEATDAVCDGTDHDCDGETNEHAPEAEIWCEDLDGDGYGNAAVCVGSCVEIEGWTRNAEDCLDDDAAARPGGSPDCAAWSDADRHVWASLRAGAGSDFWRTLLRGGRDVDGDGRADALVTLPDSNQEGGLRGSAYVLAAAHPGESWLDDAAHTRILPDPEWADLGGAAVFLGDWDSDGAEEALVRFDSAAASEVCGVPLSGGDVGHGDAVACWTGESASTAVDVDGAWLAVGDDGVVVADDGRGAVFVLPRGAPSGPTADAPSLSLQGGMDFGEYVAEAGDVDGDGLGDLFVSVRADDAHSEGAVWVMLGPFVGSRDAADGDWPIAGTSARATWNDPPEHAGDLDGDGRADLVLAQSIGASLYVDPLNVPTLDDAVAVVDEGACSDALAASPTHAGDLDGDHVSELIVGAAECSPLRFYEGAVFLFQGPVVGTRPVESAEVVITGGFASRKFGADSASVGDWNLDGAPDLLVAATPSADDMGELLVLTP